MTQDHEKRTQIRRKVADAINRIEDIMAIRHKQPNDTHDVNDVKAVARNAGEMLCRHIHDEPMDVAALLVAELEQAEKTGTIRQRAEATIAIEAVATAMGVHNQFIALHSAHVRRQAQNTNTPPEGRSAER